MTKGIATDTVIKLALGLVVLIAIGYLLWRYLGYSNTTMSESVCRARAIVYCQAASVRGYQVQVNGFTGKDSPGCKAYDWAMALDVQDITQPCKEIQSGEK